jgi:trimeric autotransporter adhesin
MKPLIKLKAITLLLMPLVLACFALLPRAQAVTPAPDGAYLGFNTAEGFNALLSLTSGTFNTAVGFSALKSDTTGIQNTATGSEALFKNTIGFQNVATGFRALVNNTTGFHNTANGFSALSSTTSGNHNTADGDLALVNNTIGNFNTTAGGHSLVHNTSGNLNIALGFAAGQNLTTGSNNIDVANGGVAGESNTIRIGNEVAFTGPEGIIHPAHTKTFIAGIRGVTVAGAAVFVNGSGQLGTAPSSQRFKDAIKPMDRTSEAILALKPVTFRYKKKVDPEGITQFGLVAEQVEKVNPDLVVRDRDGKAYTVRYDAVNAMLLNEFLKEHKAFLEERRTVQEQQNEIDALKAELKEQKALVQKVSAQLEVSKPAPQTVLNDQ